jgi:hypothetical protein
MYWSSADFSGGFRLKSKSRKAFRIIIATKPFFFLNFRFVGFGGGGCSPVPPPPLGVPLHGRTRALARALTLLTPCEQRETGDITWGGQPYIYIYIYIYIAAGKWYFAKVADGPLNWLYNDAVSCNISGAHSGVTEASVLRTFLKCLTLNEAPNFTKIYTN